MCKQSSQCLAILGLQRFSDSGIGQDVRSTWWSLKYLPAATIESWQRAVIEGVSKIFDLQGGDMRIEEGQATLGVMMNNSLASESEEMTPEHLKQREVILQRSAERRIQGSLRNGPATFTSIKDAQAWIAWLDSDD